MLYKLLATDGSQYSNLNADVMNEHVDAQTQSSSPSLFYESSFLCQGQTLNTLNTMFPIKHFSAITGPSQLLPNYIQPYKPHTFTPSVTAKVLNFNKTSIKRALFLLNMYVLFLSLHV